MISDRGVFDVADSSASEEFDARYAAAVGGRLRAVRRQKRMSLQAVERASGLEFKASVLGAYERGERTISVPRLQRLARLYRVPVGQLLPPDSSSSFPGSRATGPSPGGANAAATAGRAETAAPSRAGSVSIDLSKLDSARGAERDLLGRFLASVQLQRQDFNGEVLTVRADDLAVMASMLGRDLASLVERLEVLGIVAPGPVQRP